MLINLIPSTTITLIDIDSMAHDIDENYHGIANDYLNISLDTNQISDIDTFIEKYDKFSVNSPLQIDFVYRKDKDLIYQSVLENKMTIIAGKPGNGKTKIALEILKELKNKENIIPLCVRINGLDLYKDLKYSIDNNKKYVVFFDDINNLNGIHSIIDLIINNKNENIKILATTRNYLLDEVLNKLNSFIKSYVYILNKMSDEELIDILEKNYNVKNKEWQQKILKISNGNPRLAIMSFIAVKDKKIESLNSIYDIFKNYYDNIFEQNNITSNQKKILFYISLLSPISTSNEKVKDTLNTLLINNIDEFKKLRDMELIDYFNEDALKICDQNFANYLLYKYLIIDKEIKISDLLKLLYPNFINKFINTINMINEQFYTTETIEYISSEINTVWNEEIYNNDWKFVEYFHNVNIPKSLLIIKEKISSLNKELLPEKVIYNNNVYLNDDLLSLLSDFKNTEYSNVSLELLFLYLDKKPNHYNEICKSIKDYWLIKESHPTFKLEINIIDLLYSKYKNSPNQIMKEIYLIMLEQTLFHCLELEFHIGKQGKDLRTINFITLKLQENELVFNFRKKLFDTVFKLCNENENYYNILLNNSNWFYDKYQIEILKNDIQYLDQNYFNKWTNPSLLQSKLLYTLRNLCKKFKINIPSSIEKYKECEEFLMVNLFEKYDYDKPNEELIEYLNKQDKNGYIKIFKLLKSIDENNLKIDEWKIHNSIDLLFKELINNDIALFKEIFKLYLEIDCPFVSGLYFTRSISDKKILEDIIDIIIISNTSKKYYILTFILNNFYNEKYAKIVNNFLKNQDKLNIYTLSIETIYKYSKTNKLLLERYTKEIIELDNFSLYSSYTSSFIDEEFINKIYDSFNDKTILEELYLKSIECHGDYDGKLGYLLCINNYDFLNKILETKSYDHAGKIRNIVKEIWLNENYFEIITYNYNKILKSNFGYLRLHPLFEIDSTAIIKNNQIDWFKKKIIEFKTDKYGIYNLFYIICEKDDHIKKELILFLLDNSQDIEIFKRVNFFSHSESWSGSRIPNVERKIDFIKKILKQIKEKNSLDYIEHIDYLEKQVNNYQEKIKSIQVEEYIDDFLR